LVRRGLLTKTGRGKFDGDASVRRYIKHLRMVASGRGGEDGVLDLTAERARLAKQQADGHELKNALARGELLEVAVVERTWTGVLSMVRSRMLAVTSRVRQRLPHMTAFDADVVDRELREALTEAAGDETP
jgi:phage terminase Nu1 subunit (DNA packaging protein)